MELWAEEEGLEETEHGADVALAGPRVDCVTDAQIGNRTGIREE